RDIVPRYASLFLILLFWTACVGCQLRSTNSRAVFVRPLDWAEKGVWLQADTHIHTRYSDGSVELQEVVRQGQAHGCDVLAITDHGDANLQATSEEYFENLETARRKFPKLILLAGLEW